MDSAQDGVILFSMGSNLKSANLPAEKRDAILKALAKLKQKVLWKWEEDVLPGQPANVKLSKWLPQNDLMGNLALYYSFIRHIVSIDRVINLLRRRPENKIDFLLHRM